MKTPLIVAALIAAALLPPALQSEEKKPDAPKPESPRAEAPKKEKPAKPVVEAGKTAPPKQPVRRRDLEGEKPAPKPATASKRTWLGISTHLIEPSLRQHLEIPEGFGVQVVEVMPDSPAASAGLRSNDILVRFEDQRLISPEHLSILVRSHANGDKVSLAIIRKGREESFEVTLGEAEDNVFAPWGQAMPAHPGIEFAPQFGRDPSQWQEQIRKQQDEILRQQREWMEKHRQQRNHPGEPKTSPDPQSGPGKPEGRGEAKPGGRPPGVSVSPGFPVHVFGSEGVLKIDNDQGELTLTRKNDDHRLVIADKEGKVVYDGPFDPEKGVEGLPAAAQDQLKSMKLGDLEIRLPEVRNPNPEKTAKPKPTGEPKKETPGEIL